MPSKPTTKVAQPEAVVEEVEPVVEPEPVVVTNTTKVAKVKGTWTMYYGQSRWEFEDGKRYELPLDLYNHLLVHGNIYDTL